MSDKEKVLIRIKQDEFSKLVDQVPPVYRYSDKKISDTYGENLILPLGGMSTLVFVVEKGVEA